MSAAFKTVTIEGRFAMYRGGYLESPTLAYETWGVLNVARDNGILIFSGLSPSAHAAHGTTDDRMQSLDAEVQNNPVRRLGNVFHCQHREFQAVDLTGLRIYRSRSC